MIVEYILQALNVNKILALLKKSPLYTNTVDITGIKIPFLHLIALALYLVYYYWETISNEVVVQQLQPYELCGCDGDGNLGIASQVPTTVCPSGYRCFYNGTPPSADQDPQCIPNGILQAPNNKCKTATPSTTDNSGGF